jgi:HAD superfamily hydrolase (TIGR01509 family)
VSQFATRPVAGGPLVPGLEGVIFDCDGVLVDSERITNRVWAGLLTNLGLPTTTEQSLATYMGNSMSRCLEIVSERLGSPAPDSLLAQFHEQTAIALAEEVTAVPGIAALLDALDAAGLPYAVASNGEQAKMRTTLGVTGLAPRFEGRRFSSLDVGRPKPAPDVFLHAAEQLGIAPARTVVVEDSPTGIRGAVAAGMVVIGYAEIVSAERLIDAGARATVDHLDEVAALLGILTP